MRLAQAMSLKLQLMGVEAVRAVRVEA